MAPRLPHPCPVVIWRDRMGLLTFRQPHQTANPFLSNANLERDSHPIDIPRLNPAVVLA